MPKAVECPMSSCIWNENKECKYDGNFCLKWRFAADMGKGNIVCLECLMMQLAAPGGVS